MSITITDTALQAQISGARGTVELKTPDGRSLGLLTPVAATTSQTSFDPSEVHRLIKAIADMPEEPGGDPAVTARNHDAILYGSPKDAR